MIIRLKLMKKLNIISEYTNGSLYRKTFIKKQLKTTCYYENNIKTSETEELIKKDSVVVEKKWYKNGGSNGEISTQKRKVQLYKKRTFYYVV